MYFRGKGRTLEKNNLRSCVLCLSRPEKKIANIHGILFKESLQDLRSRESVERGLKKKDVIQTRDLSSVE